MWLDIFLAVCVCNGQVTELNNINSYILSALKICSVVVADKSL